MSGLMDAIRHALGLKASEPPPMSDEQSALADRLAAIQRRQDAIHSRLKQRQDAIDIQNEVLRADRADSRLRH